MKFTTLVAAALIVDSTQAVSFKSQLQANIKNFIEQDKAAATEAECCPTCAQPAPACGCGGGSSADAAPKKAKKAAGKRKGKK